MPESSDATRPPKRQDDASLGEVIDYVKAYAKQETLGPLKGAGSWLAYGAAGALALGLGLLLLMVGLLRLVQTEWTRSATGALSWVSYFIVLVVTVALLGFTLTRVKKAYLNKEPLPKKKS